MATESVDELTNKLGEYIEQLGQIEKLLAVTPDDPELLKLKSDLEQIVALTHDLAQPDEVPTVGDEAKWQVNDRCTALWEDGTFFAAKILEIRDGDEYLISFLDYKQKTTVSESALKPYQPAPSDQLERGTQIRAIFEEDGMFYDAVVVEKANVPGFFMVKYPKFGKAVHEISSYNIVLRAAKDPNEPLADKPVIPESLWAKPTDTEETLAQKKRKIKRIKQIHKKRKLEAQGQRKQNSWLSFQKKGPAGGLASRKKKKSIFATSVSGTVGVVGSGNAMTKNPDRKMHQYADPQLSVLDGDDNE